MSTTTSETPRVASEAVTLSDALRALAADAADSVVFVRGATGSGSGVIWDASGLVLTNHHVVPGRSAELTLRDGRRLIGQVVRRAPGLDLAALQVEDAHALPPGLPIGDSSRLRVGDLAMAVGNPMGERHAPSVGIVASAPGDVVRLSMTLRPGNSGGALVDAHGTVVGIPHMVTGRGLALAVSSRTVERFLAGAIDLDDAEASLRWI